MKYTINLYLILIILIAVLVGGVVHASNVDNAEYLTTIQITNDGDDDITNGVAVFTLSTSDMITGQWINATATDAAMLTGTGGSDIKFMPSANATYPWCTWVSSVGSHSSVYEYLYSKGVTGGDYAYFPGDDGMEITDHATIEPSANFTIELNDTWINTDAGLSKYLFEHYDVANGGIRCFISPTVSETISASIYGVSDLTTFTEVDPNGKLTVTPSTATGVDVDRDENVYLYDDKGVDYYDDINIDFEIYINSDSLDSGFGAMAITNTVDDFTGFAATDITVPIMQFAGPEYRIYLYRGFGVAEDYYVCLADTPYYITIIRAAGNDTVNAYIYSDVGRNTLVDTLTVAGFGATKYRYLYAFVNINNAIPDTDWDGYISDLTDNIATLSVTATGVAEKEYDITVESPRSLYFDASDDNVAVPTAAIISDIFDGGGTVIFWMKPDSDGENSRGRVFEKGANNVSLKNEAGGFCVLAFQQEFSGTNYQTKTSTANITIGDWEHVAVTYNNDNTANRVIFYINTNVKAEAIDLAPVGTRTSDVAQVLYIGDDNPVGGGSTSGFDGDIGGLWFYDTILTPAQITNHFNGIYDSTNLVAHWNFDEDSGAIAYDTSNNSNDGTINNATWDGDRRLQILLDATLDDTSFPTVNSAVPNSTADWIVGDDDVTLYFGEFTIDINGVEKCNIVWEYGDTFYDTSGQSNDATPTFRTASSDANITATVVSMSSTLDSIIPTVNITGGWTMVEVAPSTPDDLFTEGGSDFPFGPEIKATAEELGQDPTSWLLIVAFGLAIAALLGVYGLTHVAHMGMRGSLFLSVIAAEGVLIYFYSTETVPGMALIPFGLVALLVVAWRKSPAPVD